MIIVLCYLVDDKNVWIYLIFVWIFLEKFNTLSILNSNESVANVFLYWMRGKIYSYIVN